jgi:hypothetical protein
MNVDNFAVRNSISQTEGAEGNIWIFGRGSNKGTGDNYMTRNFII